MKLSRQGITTSVGYSFAFAALCSLAVSPGVALADEVDNSQGSSTSSEPIVSDQANNATVPSEKTETVYVFANPDGSVKNTEVSTTLKNPGSADELADSSELTDIENKESDASYSGSGKNMVWNAAGENVYYTGNTSKDAPVSVKVTYFLNGQKVSPDKLAGASGKLKIRYEYENNATVKANIRGNEETLYVPFTFITAMIFDNENFKNAEVTNGKLIDDGDRAIVAGYAMPGLKKSLGSIVDDFDIPDYFEVTADVTDFEMKSSLTIATAGLLEDVNGDDLDTSELEDASSELTSAMDQIIDGASTLKSGLDKLSKGAKSADTATGKLAKGAEKIAKGNKELANGLETMEEQTSVLPSSVDKLAKGTSDLADGVKKASNGVDTILNGYVDDEGYHPGLVLMAESTQQLVQATQGLKQEIDLIDMWANKMDLTGQSIETMSTLASQLSDEAESLNNEVVGVQEAAAKTQGTFNSVVESIGSSKSTLNGIDLEAIEDEEVRKEIQFQINDARDSLDNAEGSLNATSDMLGGITEKASSINVQSLQSTASDFVSTTDVLAQDDADTYLGKIKTLVETGLDEKTPATKTLAEKVANGAIKIDEGVNKTVGALEQLNDSKKGLPAAAAGASQVSDGVAQLNAKIPELIGGISTVVDGADKLKDGSNQLAKGADKLADGMDTLASGTDSAASGTGKLVNGLETFADEGIGAITDKIDNDLLPFTDRLDAISQAGKDYNNFAGITKGTKGSVKFIIETDPIEKDDK